MKRTKQLTILLLILAVLCLAIVVATGVERHMDSISATSVAVMAMWRVISSSCCPSSLTTSSKAKCSNRSENSGSVSL